MRKHLTQVGHEMMKGLLEQKPFDVVVVSVCYVPNIETERKGQDKQTR